MKFSPERSDFSGRRDVIGLFFKRLAFLGKLKEQMAKEKKAFTVIIVPEDISKTYTFRVRRGLLYVLAVICLLFLGSYAYIASVHQGVFSKARRVERLEAENAILRTGTQRVAELESELTGLQKVRQRLYALAGLAGDSSRIGGSISASDPSILLTGEEMNQPISEVSQAGFAEPMLEDMAHVGTSHIPSFWPVRGWVTAEFNEILPGREKKHTGIDIAGPKGAPILSAASGQVTLAEWDKNLGLVIILDHQNGLSTLYGHCSEILVEAGDLVAQGQIIAHLGNTGQSSAPHLHFEIRKDDLSLDPRTYLGP